MSADKQPSSPIRPTDNEARQLAHDLLGTARFAALGVIDPTTKAPMVSRIGFGVADDRTPMALVSDLSHHTKALVSNPACSILIGEPEGKGDPLTHPRLTLQATARFVRIKTVAYAALRSTWLQDHPKAKLYIDFADFSFVQFEVLAGHLNGGFGKAFTLAPGDLNR